MIFKRFWRLILVFGVAAIITVNLIWFPGHFLYSGRLGKILSSSVGTLVLTIVFSLLGSWSAQEFKKRGKRD